VIKNANKPVHLRITSYDHLNTVGVGLKSQGMLGWKVDVHPEAPWDLFPKDDIIMLSPDAEEVVESFDQDKVYIIGGVVDRTIKKACTLNCAYAQDIRVLRLPIKEYVPDHQSHVLNIDTIVSIICTYNETLDWLKTFEICIPKRKLTKGGKLQRKKDNLRLFNENLKKTLMLDDRIDTEII
jgi:tRNA (guanine9-N1)-methyltransferase